jgi:hypothetical protein
MGVTVELDNDRVRVLRVRHEGAEQHPRVSRNDRVIVYLSPGHVRRTANGESQHIRHAAGDVVWRSASTHEVHNLEDLAHEVIIVELK